MPTLKESLDKFLDLTDQREKIRTELSAIESERTDLEKEIVEQFALTGIQNVKTECGRTVFQKLQRNVSVKADQREQAVAVARSLGLDDLIAIQPSRFKSWAIEQLDDEATGHKLPDELAGLVNVFEQVRINVRKG